MLNKLHRVTNGQPGPSGPFSIGEFASRRLDGLTEVSACVDGFRLWFRVPDEYEVSQTGDPFLSSALLPAMSTGRPIEVDPALPVSAALLKNIAKLQEIFHSWNPNLRVVSVSATTAPAEPLNTGGISFFSGGVDSTYTLLKNISAIDRAVFIEGFDFGPDNKGYEVALQRRVDFVRSFGVELLPVETNHFDFGYRYHLSRNLTHGSCLAAIAQVLGFATAFIPSSDIYACIPPLGSHPLTDPLWSTEALTIVHDGCEATRPAKLRSICVHDAVQKGLQVCFHEPHENCGKCRKCRRTMIALRSLGLSIPAFPPMTSLSIVRREVYRDPSWTIELREEYAYACALEGEAGRAFRKALRTAIRRNELLQVVGVVDGALLGGALENAYETWRNPKGVLIGTTPGPGDRGGVAPYGPQ